MVVLLVTAGLLSATATRPAFALIEETKNFADAAGEASSQLRELDPEKKLAALTKVAGGLDKLAALGPLLGLIGSGLDLILVLGGAKTDTDLILDGIQDIKDQIGRLDTKITVLTTEVQDHTTAEAVASALTASFNDIDTPFSTWDQSQRLMNPDLNVTTTMTRMPELLRSAKLIANYCQGRSAAEPLFPLLERVSHGDAAVITNWATLAIGRIAQAEIVDAFLFRVQEQAKQSTQLTRTSADDLQTRSEVQSKQKYESLLKDCHDAFVQSLARIKENRRDHVVKYLHHFFNYNLGKGARTIGETLKLKYPDKEWVVAIYKPVWGFYNHLIIGPGNRETQDEFFRQTIGGEEKNFVAYWSDKVADPFRFNDRLASQVKNYSFMCEREWCAIECFPGETTCDHYSVLPYPFPPGRYWRKYWNYDIRTKIEGVDAKPPAFRIFGRMSQTDAPDLYVSNPLGASYSYSGGDLWSIFAD